VRKYSDRICDVAADVDCLCRPPMYVTVVECIVGDII